MRPGDQVKCARCGTTAIAYSTQPGTWTEGRALLVSWHGYRHEAVPGHAAAEGRLCLLCHYGETPPARQVSRRGAICDDLARHGCLADGFEWNTDQAVEDAYQAWLRGGRPPCVIVACHPLVAATPAAPPPAPARGQLGLFG